MKDDGKAECLRYMVKNNGWWVRVDDEEEIIMMGLLSVV